MSKTIEIEEPHGYLIDADGNVIQRFGNWSVGEREVHPETKTVEYVNGPADHERDVHEDYKSVQP